MVSTYILHCCENNASVVATTPFVIRFSIKICLKSVLRQPAAIGSFSRYNPYLGGISQPVQRPIEEQQPHSAYIEDLFEQSKYKDSLGPYISELKLVYWTGFS